MAAACSILEVEDTKLCIECHTTRGPPTGSSRGFRCTDCNSLKSRVQRVLTKVGQEQASAFRGLSKNEKMEFFAKHRTTMGEELSVAIQEATIRVTKRVESIEFNGTGEFMDEADIREKYGKKPEQAEAILQNSRSMFDPMRQVILYEDMKYNAKVGNSDMLETTTGLTITHDRCVKGKPAKKAQSAKGVAIKGEGVEKAIGLSESQKISLEQLTADIADLNGKLHVELQTIKTNEVQEYMVQATITQAEACGFKLKEYVAIVELALDSNSGDFKVLKSQHRELKTHCNEQVRRLKAQMKAAMSLKIEMLGEKVPKAKKRKAVEVVPEVDTELETQEGVEVPAPLNID